MGDSQMRTIDCIRLLESKKTIEVLLDALDNHMDSENDPNYPNPDGWFGMARLYYNEKGNADHVKYDIVKKLVAYHILEKDDAGIRNHIVVRLTNSGYKIAYHMLTSVELINDANQEMLID